MGVISINILYILYFNAPMGGLHENVYNSAKFMKNNGCNVTVMVKPGPFANKLNNIDINTITTDFEDLDSDIELLENSNLNLDIIHFHPGKGRFVALDYSAKYNIPLVYTVHGKWHGQLNLFIKQLDAVITVSEGVNDYIKSKIPTSHEKFHIIQNGYDTNIFSNPDFKNISDTIHIGYVTRFDDDKSFIIDVLYQITNYLSHYYKQKVNIFLIGSGTLKESFVKKVNELLKESIHEVKDYGWLQGEKLTNAYSVCDIIIAPGRSAIEGMASGKPVIAVGSKNYIGLINKKTWQFGVYNNFGGIGNKFDDYLDGHIENDMDTLLLDTKNINKHGHFAHEIAKVIYDDNIIQEKLLDIYKLILNAQTL